MSDAREPATTVLLVAGDGTEVVVGRVVEPADLKLVDALARLQLHAARRGERVRLHTSSEQLRELLGLVGLGGVLGLEPLGQPELGEQRRADEVMQADDLLA